MPTVSIKMYEGRSLDQKRAMAKKVTEAICETLNVKPEGVNIYIEETKKEHHANAGILAVDKDQ